MILAVTGHRPPKVGGYNVPNPVYDAIMRAMDECLIALQPNYVITGMALGIDQWMAELCVMNEIPFVAAIPFDGFDSRWPDISKDHYRRLLSRAAEIKVISPGAPYDPRLMQVRNQWMVRQCDKLLAVFNNSTGGTANCIRAARNMNKEVLLANISPEIWALARIVEADSDERAELRRNEVVAARRANQEALMILAEEGRIARERMARQHEEEEARRHPLRRRREEAHEVEWVVPPGVSEDIEKMREELDRRILAASQIPAELLDPGRAEKVVVETALAKRQAVEEEERTMPKRLIEIGED